MSYIPLFIDRGIERPNARERNCKKEEEKSAPFLSFLPFLRSFVRRKERRMMQVCIQEESRLSAAFGQRKDDQGRGGNWLGGGRRDTSVYN